MVHTHGPAAWSTGWRDSIRGYRAMYRDFADAIHTGSATPQMSVECALEDDSTDGNRWPVPDLDIDVVIVGAAPGAAPMARAFAGQDASGPGLERGTWVRQEKENWDPAAVLGEQRYCADERWVDRKGREFRPFMHYVVGGNTKVWGAAPSASGPSTSRPSSTRAASPRPGPSTDPAPSATLVRRGQASAPRSAASTALLIPPRGPQPFRYPAVPHVLRRRPRRSALRHGVHRSRCRWA